jgi:hypothetical protein
MADYVTPHELAKRYGVAPQKVLDWINSGELMAVNTVSTLNRRPRWRIPPSAIEAFEAARRKVPAPRIQCCPLKS